MIFSLRKPIPFGVFLRPVFVVRRCAGNYMQDQLIKAARIGNLARVRDLIARGADVNADSNGIRPLTASALAGHLAIVEFMLESGADVNQKDAAGNTALMEASLRGHGDVVRLLLNGGAAVNLANSEGETALLRACLWGTPKWSSCYGGSGLR